ncbi:MAG TPA: hypothetical protein VK525_14595 [Candidatus Saccharimonadales bacterium]|nr:hypothetical protein [Candidatus Saccharimonadales bacterium]
MKTKWVAAAALLVFLAALGFYGYQRWSSARGGDRNALLAQMPGDASAVIYIDFQESRNAPFFSALYKWAPKPQADAEYGQFLKATGFDYERDLDRIAIATQKHGRESDLFAVAEGRFDRRKIAAYAARFGTIAKQNGYDIYSVPMNDVSRRMTFVFLRDNRIALTDDPNFSLLLAAPAANADAAEWRTRFARLAGSPIFAVLRQDAAAGSALASEAPGGLRSPQLATLLDSLEWITVAAVPQDNGLRIVADGESRSDRIIKQLTDALAGIVQLAEIGLNDAKTRNQLNPRAREAYLELLKSADVSKVDRGTTQSVRLVFDLTPKFLEAAEKTSPATPEAPSQAKPPARKTPRSSK